ncbi:hypothetical protein DRO54_10610 [Candidatus Bathyarchaeota archaeon]|nr:MAG: hypothetical protein DRO54_10610 [Candidatus Bathyarchaeota archaeon]
MAEVPRAMWAILPKYRGVRGVSVFWDEKRKGKRVLPRAFVLALQELHPERYKEIAYFPSAEEALSYARKDPNGVFDERMERLRERLGERLSRLADRVEEIRRRGELPLWAEARFSNLLERLHEAETESELRDLEADINDFENKLRQLERPKVKEVIPPVPERCPICGAPLYEVTRVPIGPIRVKLPAEEEYERVRLGIPVPEKEIVWLDIPPTMKVYACTNDHLFERTATGELIQRTPEFIYRKIIREWAKIRREVAAPKITEIVAPPTPRPGRPRKLQDTFWWWLENIKKISREQFSKLSDAEAKRLAEEFGKWVSGQA